MADERQISADEIASWYTPIEACRYAAKIVGTKGAANAIWQRLVGGMIEAASTTSSKTVKDYSPKPNPNPELIPCHFWKRFSSTGSDIWGAGDARFYFPGGRHGGQSITYQCFGIKLNPRDVHATLPSLPPAPLTKKPEQSVQSIPEGEPPQPVAPASTSKGNKGGRPPKEWWDDFWVGIFVKIYVGELQPKRQADLERAMADWVSAHGYDASEQTIRKAARKLFGALQEEDKN